MSMVEEQAKELGVDAAGGAKDGGQERDIMIVSVGMLILIFGVLLEFVSCFLISCRMLKKTVKGEIKLREAKATTLGIVLHAHSCAMRGKQGTRLSFEYL